MTKNGDWVSNDSVSKDQTVPVITQKPGGYQLCSLLSSDPAPTRHVIPVFLSVIAALEQAHLQTLAPCNLDPEKVFFRDDGTIELSSLKSAASGMTAVLGSFKYCAPEMVEDAVGQQPDRALIESYVLGFVFYEILLGQSRFEEQFKDIHHRGDFGWLAWHADKTKRAQPLNSLIHGFPSILSGLIDGMMAKEASARIVDLRRISDAIGNATQTTTVISNLSALQSSEKRHVSIPTKVDTFWRNVMRTAGSRLRGVWWGRFFVGRHKKVHSSVSAHR